DDERVNAKIFNNVLIILNRKAEQEDADYIN
ncbi:unnamed protein product, partial [Rotaria magnacalcarata]